MNFQENLRVQKVASATGVDIVTIVTIIIAMVEMWKKCGVPEKAIQRRMRNPGLVWRLALKNKVKEEVPPEKVDEVYDAIIEQGKTISLAEIRAIL